MAQEQDVGCDVFLTDWEIEAFLYIYLIYWTLVV